MKNVFRVFGTIALAAVIGFSMLSCNDGSGDDGSGKGGGSGTAPTVTTAALPGGTVGTAYSHTLTATGDTPITWSVAAGTLPAGLSLSTAGVISGTPTTADTFNFTVKATNTAGNGTQPLSIVIASSGGTPDNSTPTAADYDISDNLTQEPDDVTAVTVTAKSGTSTGAVTVWYSGTGETSYSKSITLPSASGTYAVTFDVAAAEGWDAVNGLAAGTLTIYPIPPRVWTAAGQTGIIGPGNIVQTIAYVNNEFIFFAPTSSGTMYKCTSTDGITWTRTTVGSIGGSVNGFAYGDNNKSVTVGANGRITCSTDGGNPGTGGDWYELITNSTFGTSAINAIAYANGKFVAGGAAGKMAWSTDGENWTAVADSTFGTSEIYRIAYANNMFVAVGNDGKMATSPDGVTWTAVADSTFGTSYITCIVYVNNKFVAGGFGGKTATSPDGVTWTAVADSTFDTSYNITCIAYANNTFVAGSLDGKMAWSRDGKNWTAVADSTFGTSTIYGIAYANNTFVAVGSSSSGTNKVPWSKIGD